METSKQSSFLTRALSGMVLVAVILGAIFFSPYTLMTLMAVLCICSMVEFNKIARQTGAEPLDTYPALVGGLMVVAAFFWKIGDLDPKAFLVLIPAVFALFIIELYRKKTTPFANIAWTVLALLYIAVPFALLAMMPVGTLPGRMILYKPLLMVTIFLVVWSNDVGAYLLGITFGRHRLMERISPKKSWEGFFGGLICAVGMGLLMASIMKSSYLYWGGASLVIALAGVFGDLVESMLKRSAGLKDSGNLIPGHGGLLDRFDALLLAAPFVFVYFAIFAR